MITIPFNANYQAEVTRERIRRWGVDTLDEVTRREIRLAADANFTRVVRGALGENLTFDGAASAGGITRQTIVDALHLIPAMRRRT
jgi:hypothetical protein